MADEKFNKILEDLTDIKVILTRHEIYHESNTRILEEHMRRTRAAETRIEMLHEADTTLKEKIDEKLDPIKRHVDMVNTTIKVVGVTLTALGAIIMALYSMGILQKLF
jgi:hypothetical protein